MADVWAEILELLWLIIPLAILQFTITVIALRSWYKKRDLLGQNKILWLLVILFINMIGPIIWLYYNHNTLLESSDGVDDWET
ncbi:MAG: PLDc N-terminal domain-containing protein [Candidatus Hodarchaeales archaeon]